MVKKPYDDWKTMWVKKDTHKKVMLFKIQSRAKNIDEVISRAIKLLKKYHNDRP